LNENLRDAMARARLRPTDVAAELKVTPKTVTRWIGGRTPYPRNRAELAGLLDADEAELWPDLERCQVAASGIVAIYPHRWAVPRPVWLHLFESAEEEIAILAYSGLFLAEDAGIMRILADKAEAGVIVRILLGDPTSEAVAERGTDEGIGPDVMSAKIRNALTLYRPLGDLDSVELRLHGSILYNSIYRADGQLMVNAHIYGAPAAQATTWHIRATDGADLITTYLDSFDRVWHSARPINDVS
jgi:hypothetical protein